MSKIIHKQVLSTGITVNILRMPRGAEIIHFDMQGNDPCIWYQFDSKELTEPDPRGPEKRGFMIVGTGKEFGDHTKHVGTAQHGLEVWHLFEMVNMRKIESIGTVGSGEENHCGSCGRELPEPDECNNWQFRGVCHAICAAEYGLLCAKFDDRQWGKDAQIEFVEAVKVVISLAKDQHAEEYKTAELLEMMGFVQFHGDTAFPNVSFKQDEFGWRIKGLKPFEDNTVYFTALEAFEALKEM